MRTFAIIATFAFIANAQTQAEIDAATADAQSQLNDLGA